MVSQVVSILDKYAEDHGIVYSTVPSTGKGSSSGSQQQQQQQKLQRDNQSQQSRFATSGRSSPFGQRSFASATSGGCQHNTELPTGGLSWARNVGQQTSAENHPGDGAASGAAGGKKRRQRGRGKRNAGQRAKELSQSGGTLSQDSLPGAGLDQNITTMGGDQDMNGIGQLGAGGFQDEMDNGNGSSQLGQPPTELSASASSFKPTFSPPNSGPNSPQHSPAAASVDPGSENLSRLNSWVLPEPTDQDQMAAQMAAGSSSTTVSPTMLSPIGGERRQVPHVSLGAGFDRSPGGGQPSVLSHQSLFDGILPRSSSWVPDLPLPMPIHASPLSQDSHPFAKTGGHNPNGSSLLGGGGGGGAIDAMAASAAKHKTILHSLQAGNTATGLEETFQNFGLGGPGAIAAASSASGDQHSPRPGSQLGWAGPVDESPMERPTAGHPVEQQPYGALRGNDDALSSKMSAGWGEGHGGGNVGGRSKASASHGAASSEEWDSFGPSTPVRQQCSHDRKGNLGSCNLTAQHYSREQCCANVFARPSVRPSRHQPSSSLAVWSSSLV